VVPDTSLSATEIDRMGEGLEMGSITSGKLANMVVLSSNPLDDVRHMRSVLMSVKRGREFPRSDYRP
jgi:imidazolonepropionase-like amidohydrolase